ncbi:MAG: MarR family winged helix-turn-helix transcriptional regulator [Leifsonia sp.]|uniref:MarR family winged helix-turn-helix transcriptional regulator n=1 Tax=Leifsonia sp. TaxID=1870902 RepID=UPI003F7DCC0F
MIERTDEAGDRLTELVDEVFRLSDALARAGDAIVAEEGLSASRWRTLGAITAGPLSVAEIARRRGMRRQSASESVAQLEAAGLVIRTPDPRDARAPRVSLTAAGRETLRRIRPRRKAWAAHTARIATVEELTAAVGLARRLRAELEAAER